MLSSWLNHLALILLFHTFFFSQLAHCWKSHRSFCFFLSYISLSMLNFLLEKEMATHSSILAWIIPWTEEPEGLQSTGSQRVRYDKYMGLAQNVFDSWLSSNPFSENARTCRTFLLIKSLVFKYISESLQPFSF